MSVKISQADLMEVLTNDKSWEQLEKDLESVGFDTNMVSVYNYDPKLLRDYVDCKRALKVPNAPQEYLDKSKARLVVLTKAFAQSNEQKRSIDDIMYEIELEQQVKDDLGEILNAFEDPTNEDRFFLIMGETGVGKTYLTTQRFLTKGYPMIAANSSMEPFDLMYELMPDPNTKELVQKPTLFHNAIVQGIPVIIDEFNAFNHNTKMFIQTLTDKKPYITLGSKMVNIAKGFKILGTMNPPSETDEREPLGDALLGRAITHIIELTDDIICERLKVNKEWLNAIRQLFNYIKNSGFVDVRELDYRDYDKMVRYDFENQLKSKVCQGDVSNIRLYSQVRSTGEYTQLATEIRKIMVAMKRGK